MKTVFIYAQPRQRKECEVYLLDVEDGINLQEARDQFLSKVNPNDYQRVFAMERAIK